MAGVLRVLVVDDHEMFSDALALLFALESGIDLVASVGAGEEAVTRCRDEAPDVPDGRGPFGHGRHRGHPTHPLGVAATRVVVLREL